MKFYEVQDEYEDYIAVIWAIDVDEAKDIYLRDIADDKMLYVVEIDIDELYKRMFENINASKEHDCAVFEIMGRLQAIISSMVPVVVLTRGVD